MKGSLSLGQSVLSTIFFLRGQIASSVTCFSSEPRQTEVEAMTWPKTCWKGVSTVAIFRIQLSRLWCQCLCHFHSKRVLCRILIWHWQVRVSWKCMNARPVSTWCPLLTLPLRRIPWQMVHPVLPDGDGEERSCLGHQKPRRSDGLFQHNPRHADDDGVRLFLLIL